jgi:hypothetical protein
MGSKFARLSAMDGASPVVGVMDPLGDAHWGRDLIPRLSDRGRLVDLRLDKRRPRRPMWEMS